MCDKSKFDIDEYGKQYGVSTYGGWDIDMSEKTQKESDGGHIPGRYQWEETVDVSSEDEEKSDDNE